jgi:hypothetical protein
VFVGVGVGVGVGPQLPTPIVTSEYAYVNVPLHAQNGAFEVVPGKLYD